MVLGLNPQGGGQKPTTVLKAPDFMVVVNFLLDSMAADTPSPGKHL